MYGLPRELDLTFFMGREILQICFGTNDLVLNFDDAVTISISSAISVSCGEQGVKTEMYIEVAQQLSRVLQVPVTAVNVVNDGKALSISFANGFELLIWDDSGRV